jgi:hypothetical protein
MRAVAAVGLAGVFIGAALWAAPAPAADPDRSAASTPSAAAPVPEEDIRDIRGPKYVAPNWVLPVVIASVAMLALAIYGFWRWRRSPRARILLPYEIALQRLEDIQTLMQPADAREFSTAVSDIVRNYIERQFEVAVTRRTTEEFLRDLLQTANAALARHQGLLGEFLHQCDFVKFAGIALTTQNMETLRQSARTFVLATAKLEEVSTVQEAHDALPTA